MKRIWLVAAVLTSLPLALQAQDRDPRLGGRLERLRLTEEQRAQIRTLREEHRAAERQRVQDFRERMNRILTDEQRARLEEFRQQRLHRRELQRDALRRGEFRRELVRREMVRRDLVRRHMLRRELTRRRFRDRPLRGEMIHRDRFRNDYYWRD